MRVPDYYVRLVELPPTVLGATLPNDDGTFSVYINARLGDAARRETLCHELEHMARDHFYQSAPIAAQEAEARGETAPSAPPELPPPPWYTTMNLLLTESRAMKPAVPSIST